MVDSYISVSEKRTNLALLCQIIRIGELAVPPAATRAEGKGHVIMHCTSTIVHTYLQPVQKCTHG